MHLLGALDPGTYDLVVWNRAIAVCARGRIEVETEPKFIELACMRSGASVRGEVVARCDGVLVDLPLYATLSIPGFGDAWHKTVRWDDYFLDSHGAIRHGAFELQSVPPDIDLEVIVYESSDTQRALVRRPFRVASGESADLGVIDVDVR